MDDDNDLDRPQPAEEVEFLTGLTIENLVAEAIWEQIELDREMNGQSSREDSPPRIDSGFQRDFNNL